MIEKTKLMFPRHLARVTGILSGDRFECSIISWGDYPEEVQSKILKSNNHQITRMLNAEYESENDILIYLSNDVIMGVGYIKTMW